MGKNRPAARTLAREIGTRAAEMGCVLADDEDPSVAELVLQCAERRVRVDAFQHQLSAGA